jgi:hypothetical protein
MPSEETKKALAGHAPSEAEIAAVITAQTGYTASPEEVKIIAARLQFVQPQLDQLRAEVLEETEPWRAATADLDGGGRR